MIKCNIANLVINKMRKQGVEIVKKGEMQVVHNDDLVEFLKSIEEYDKVINGQARCQFCGKIITLDNIRSIFPLDGEIAYCCDSKECYGLLIEGCNGDV